MIILQLTTTEFLGALTLISVLMFAAVLLAYAMGAGSVNVDLEVKRKRSAVESSGFGAPPPSPPPRRPFLRGQISGYQPDCGLQPATSYPPMPKCKPPGEE